MSSEESYPCWICDGTVKKMENPTSVVIAYKCDRCGAPYSKWELEYNKKCREGFYD